MITSKSMPVWKKKKKKTGQGNLISVFHLDAEVIWTERRRKVKFSNRQTLTRGICCQARSPPIDESWKITSGGHKRCNCQQQIKCLSRNKVGNGKQLQNHTWAAPGNVIPAPTSSLGRSCAQRQRGHTWVRVLSLRLWLPGMWRGLTGFYK